MVNLSFLPLPPFPPSHPTSLSSPHTSLPLPTQPPSLLPPPIPSLPTRPHPLFPSLPFPPVPISLPHSLSHLLHRRFHCLFVFPPPLSRTCNTFSSYLHFHYSSALRHTSYPYHLPRRSIGAPSYMLNASARFKIASSLA